MNVFPTEPLEKSTADFAVVAIASAAGGLDALIKILPAITEDSGMAYIILSANSPGEQIENLNQHSKIPVEEIINSINLLPNRIYLVPHNNNVVVGDGILQLKPIVRGHKTNNSIDLFFESVAQVHKSFAIGVILSGTAFDGTVGCKRIKELEGATIAQDPQTAIFKGMPQSVIDSDVVDFIAAPENIPAQLLKIRNSYIANHAYTDQEQVPKNDEEIFAQIINLVFLRTGNDFRNYKQPTIRRRIARRMVIVRRDTISDYYKLLQNDKAEQDHLFNDLLISVTYFFRDETFFDTLSETALPLLFKNITDNTLRIWIAGCATGEEAYSLAICLHEYILIKNKTDLKIQIFASDISENCITKARAATYTTQDVREISSERLNNYFVKRNGRYHVNKIIRDMCIFASHNFVKDPPFARIDLVSCRNVLIYFNPQLQNKVLGSFHYALKEKGLLFLGKSESIASAPNLFEAMGKSDKIYIRKFAANRLIPEAFNAVQNIILNKSKSLQSTGIPETDFRKIASEILFSQFTPASVVIDKHLEIIHFHGDNRDFLYPSIGKPNFNILKMAHDDLSFELRNAIIQVKNEKISIHRENIQLKKQPYLVSFKVIALENDYEHLMVVFYKKELPGNSSENNLNSKSADQQRIEELEKELFQVREDIKRVSDEQQTAVEELQTTNEELLSSSEELQAMNEELETSTEELQSNNEELICVNDELLDRQDQLIATQNYSESIINTIREPLIVIDKNFIIKSANPAFYKYFSISESQTEGQGFFEIGNCQWNIPDFKAQIIKILNGVGTMENYKVDVNCSGVGKKTMLINARQIKNTKPEGMILLVLEDITDLISSNELLTAKNLELQKHNQQLELFTSAASHDLQEPLRKIQMFTKRHYDNEKNLSDLGKNNIERVLFLAENMSHLINDLINYSKINFIGRDLKKTDLNALLKKTITDLKDIISKKNAKITAGLLPILNVIPFQFQQLLTNLISNSLKYSKEDIVPEITIEAQDPSDEELKTIGANTEKEYIKLCVSDNGIGFAKDYEIRIFDPFYRLHNRDKYSGTGLGLTLVKQIVDNHHGYIIAQSTVSEGAKFFIYFPR